MLPREHGGWAMLAAPALVGWAAAGGGPPGAAALFVLALLGAFLARTPLTAVMASPSDGRALRWLSLYAACAVLGLAGLSAAYSRWGLLPLGIPASAVLAASLWYTARRRAMTVAHELLAVAGLSLGAPGAHYAASGSWSPDAAWLWALCALYFAGPVFHVKMLVLGRASPERAAQAAADSAAFHAAAFGAAAAGVIAGNLPAVVALPFLGALAKTLYFGRRLGGRLELKRVGWQEVGWSVVFAAVSAGAFRG